MMQIPSGSLLSAEQSPPPASQPRTPVRKHSNGVLSPQFAQVVQKFAIISLNYTLHVHSLDSPNCRRVRVQAFDVE